MPMNPNNFALYRPLQAHSQAYLQVRLIGPRPSIMIATLLDTGAAYSIFDEALARRVGYALPSLPIVRITLANGRTARLRAILHALLEIEGRIVTIRRILLHRVVNATPLLAAKDLLPRTEFGYGTKSFFFDY